MEAADRPQGPRRTERAGHLELAPLDPELLQCSPPPQHHPSMSDWVTLLQRHAAALPPGPTPESLEADCEAAFAALADERRAADVSAHPSYAVIPPFFRGRASSEDGGTDFARLLNRAAKMNRLQARETQMVDGDDLEALERALAAVVARASASDEPPSPDSPGAPRPEPPRMLGYDEYRSLRDSRALAPKLRHRLTARLFLRLPRDPRGRVRCEDLLHHMCVCALRCVRLFVCVVFLRSAPPPHSPSRADTRRQSRPKRGTSSNASTATARTP